MIGFCKWWRKDSQDEEYLTRAKDAKNKADDLHRAFMIQRGKAEILSKNMQESRERNHYGESLSAAYGLKSPKRNENE